MIKLINEREYAISTATYNDYKSLDLRPAGDSELGETSVTVIDDSEDNDFESPTIELDLDGGLDPLSIGANRELIELLEAAAVIANAFDAHYAEAVANRSQPVILDTEPPKS